VIRPEKIGEVADVVAGVGFPREMQGHEEGEIPVFKVGDISAAWLAGERVLRTSRNYLSADHARRLGKPVPAGSTVFAKIGEALRLNRRAILGQPSLIDNNVMGVVPRTGALTPLYLFYFMQTVDLGKLARATAVPSVRKSDVVDIGIPLPSLAEQERAVAEIEKQFSRLDQAGANLKRVKANLNRYKAAVLKAAVEGRLVPTEAELARRFSCRAAAAIDLLKDDATTQLKKRAGRLWGSGHVPALTNDEAEALPEGWAWVKVRDLGYSTEDAVQVGPMSMKSLEFADAGVPVLNVGCVQWDYFDETKLNFLPNQAAARFARYRIRPGDVLFTRSGTVGRCAVAQSHQENWLMTFHLLRARPDPRKCLPEYLRAVLEGAPHIRRQTREASIGSTRAGFNTNLLAGLDVPLPPSEEQRRIVTEVERLLSIARAASAELESAQLRVAALRSAVLSYTFKLGRNAEPMGE
jgi:type I restriction enzyme S subunit